VAKPIVDQLEVIEVDEQDSDTAELSICSGKRLLQPIGQQGTIRQASQRVMERHLLELSLERLALSDIAIGHDDAVHGGLIQQVVRNYLEVMPRTPRME
jgi:hypothetical protein